MRSGTALCTSRGGVLDEIVYHQPIIIHLLAIILTTSSSITHVTNSSNKQYCVSILVLIQCGLHAGLEPTGTKTNQGYRHGSGAGDSLRAPAPVGIAMAD